MAVTKFEHNQTIRDHADFINTDDSLRKSFGAFIRQLAGERARAGEIYKNEIEPFVRDFQASTCPPERPCHLFLTDKIRDVKSGGNPSMIAPFLAWAWHSKRKAKDGGDVSDFYRKHNLYGMLGQKKLTYDGEPGEWASERPEAPQPERQPIKRKLGEIQSSIKVLQETISIGLASQKNSQKIQGNGDPERAMAELDKLKSLNQNTPPDIEGKPEELIGYTLFLYSNVYKNSFNRREFLRAVSYLPRLDELSIDSIEEASRLNESIFRSFRVMSDRIRRKYTKEQSECVDSIGAALEHISKRYIDLIIDVKKFSLVEEAEPLNGFILARHIENEAKVIGKIERSLRDQLHQLAIGLGLLEDMVACSEYRQYIATHNPDGIVSNVRTASSVLGALVMSLRLQEKKSQRDLQEREQQ